MCFLNFLDYLSVSLNFLQHILDNDAVFFCMSESIIHFGTDVLSIMIFIMSDVARNIFGGKALSISKTPSLGQTLKIELLGQRPYVFLRFLTHIAIRLERLYQFILPPPVESESPKVEVFWAHPRVSAQNSVWGSCSLDQSIGSWQQF